MSCFVLAASRQALADDNLNDIPDELVVPDISSGAPAPGKRVWQNIAGFEGGNVAHALYLPSDWKPDGSFPVIVEYPGNGGYRNSYGDHSSGEISGCVLGYGLTAGKGAIWVCLPFVDAKTKKHTTRWWGDADLTAKYCRETVQLTCELFGGDRQRLILAGFSRGAIAGNYIGLRDDEISKLWRGFFLHSHYDGVRRWGHAGDDRESAARRLQRLGTRPQFISHELSTRDVETYLNEPPAAAALKKDQLTFLALPYPNHSARWILKDIPERKVAREWLRRVLK